MKRGRKTRLRVLPGHDEKGFDCTAVLGMVRIVRSFTDEHVVVARRYKLNLPRLEVLLCLRSGEGISQQELCKRLLVTKGNVSMTLKAMESEGLIERRVDKADNRVHQLYVTTAGQRLLAKIMPALNALMMRMLGVLSADELRTLKTLVGRIEQTFGDSVGG